MFYTMQSNILVILLFAMLTVRTATGLRYGETGSAGYFARFDRIGVQSLAYIGVMVIFFLLAGHAFYYVDSKLRKA